MSTQLVTNARIVTADEVFSGTVEVRDGIFARVDSGTTALPRAQDWDGDYLIAAQIELHTDNLERHLEPRPGVRWPALSALLTHDAQISSAGIATVLNGMRVGDFDGGSNRAQDLHDATQALRHARAHRLLRAEHLLHIRCELACDNMLEVVAPVLDDPSVRLVSLMDHTPGQRQWTDVERFRVYTQRDQRWSDDHLAQVVEERQAMQVRNAQRHRTGLLALCRDRHIPLASHDDTEAGHVEQAVACGVSIAEFPTTLEAAQAARRHGLSIIMGAPNLVRGGSHSGNVPALELARADLLDCLSSDYVPHALLHAAFLLRDLAGWSLPKALATTTVNPARMVGLPDRGRIAAGKRADFVRVRETAPGTHTGAVPVPLATWREGERIA